MTRPFSTLLLAALLALALSACDSGGGGDEEEPPEETEENNSFRVDGTLYTAGTSASGGPMFAQLQETGSLTTLAVFLPSVDGDDIHYASFFVQGVESPGTYTIIPLTDPDPEVTGSAGEAQYTLCSNYDSGTEECEEEVAYSTQSTWTLTITEINDDRVAGGFEFVAVIDDDGNTVEVTDGQFDLNPF